MPNSIDNIKHHRHQIFHSKLSLQECIESYFKYLEGEFETVQLPSKVKDPLENIEQKVWLREKEPPTISGFAFYLGFASRQDFDSYELKGKYGKVLKRGRLRIEAAYEKKLHGTNASGAIFALKALGWNEKLETLPILSGQIKIEIIDNGKHPASSEAAVEL